MRIIGAWYRGVDDSLVSDRVLAQVQELRRKCGVPCSKAGEGVLLHDTFHLVTVIDKEKQVRMTWDPVPYVHASEAHAAWERLVSDARVKHRGLKEHVVRNPRWHMTCLWLW